MPISHTLLEPGFTGEILKNVSFTFNPSTPSLFASTSFIYIALVSACVLATGFVLIRGSMFRIQASEAGIRKSNEEWKRGSLGLLGVLSLFLILYTLNRDLLVGDVGLDGLRAGRGAVGIMPANPTGESVVPSTPTTQESVARKIVLDAGIGINKDACTETQMREKAPSCTNLGGLPQETLDMLLALKVACKCDVVITGGTEPGHTSHGVGKRPVDLRINSVNDPLYLFIKKNGSKFSDTPCYEKWGWNNGVTKNFLFWDESPPGCGSGLRHFHVY